MALDSVGIVLDEISLEGLEGITLASLWIRLGDANFPLDLSEAGVQRFIWSNIIFDRTSSGDLQIFTLPKPRKTIQLFDRYQYTSPDSGVCLETDSVPKDVYGIVTPVTDGLIRGSCSEYNSRKDITSIVLENNRSMDEVNQMYGDRLVIVASQRLRECALRLSSCEPGLPLTEMQYCILEKIGRTRKYGEVTVGKEASQYREQPKTLFYYRKLLLSRGLIKKQQHIITIPPSGQNRVGLVLTLPRFHSIHLMPLARAALKLSQMLMRYPDRECDYYVLQELLSLKKKLFRSIFTNYDKNFAIIDYKDEEKENEILRKIRLKKPVDFEAEDESEEEDVEDNDNDVVADTPRKIRNFSQYSKTFDPKLILVDKSLANQVLELIDRWDSADGISLREIGEELRLPKLIVRQIVRVLERSNEIVTEMIDHGKQKINKIKSINKRDESELHPKAQDDSLKFAKNETALFRQRANIILEAVRKNLIYDELVTFKKLIMTSEKESKYTVDRRSIKNVINKLALNGYLRYIRTLLTYQGKEYKFEIVCDPSITTNSPLVRDRIETKKFRLFGAIGDDSYFPQKILRGKSNSQTTNAFECELKFKPSVARRYGYQPKMPKLMTLYKFLFYLMKVSDKRKYRDWRQNIPKLILSSDGSCTLGDLIPRLPLEIYVKIVFISYEIPELENYLSDQGRRNLTMQMLPPSLRKKLMLKRKYIFNIFEELVCLSHLNLVGIEYRDQCTKETTKIFLNTTISFNDFGIVREYDFQSLEDIEVFISDLIVHCSRIDCVDCSFEPALFVHNQRNWTYSPQLKESNKINGTLNPVKRKPKPLKNPPSSTISSATSSGLSLLAESSSTATPAAVAAKQRKRKREKESKPEEQRKPKKRKTEHHDMIDKLALRRKTKQRVQWTKEEDCFLLMCRIASILLDPNCPTFVCVPGNVVRDELHKHLPELSADKTIKACQRRLNYMLKKSETRENVMEWVSDVKQEIDSLNLGKPECPKTDIDAWSDAFLKYLHILLTKFQAYHLSLSSTSSNEAFKQFNSLEELLTEHKIVETQVDIMLSRPQLFQEPHNIVDICVAAVTNVIVSSLLGETFDKSEGCQGVEQTLFKIYQKYPDTLIRSVITKLSRNRVMTKKRSANGKVSFQRSRGVAPYKISQAYLFALKTKYIVSELPIDIRPGPIGITKDLSRGEVAVAVALFTSGKANFSIEIPENFVSFDRSKMDFRSTDQSEFSRNYEDPKLASRYSLQCYRKQLTEGKFPLIHHSQDYLLVNSCSVICSGIIDELDFSMFFNDLEIDSVLRPPRRPELNDHRLSRLASLVQSFKELGAIRENLSDWNEAEISQLLSSKIIFKVGVNQHRYVHYEHVDHWLIHSGTTENPNLTFVPKFWKDIYGHTNKRVLFKLLSVVLANIWLRPGISRPFLAEVLTNVLCPAQTEDVLKFLESLGCLQTIQILQSKEVSLFDDDNVDEISNDPNNYVTYLMASPDSFIILCQLKAQMGC
ncbi:general transcription factor 3C polypeptide 1 [Brevipalpus obovatus]|uniref:general transcription factor 3C polypeptide 1 n=1 Tax=Brevipalpus obovatus TaxID=246614 RepID=UPI003D9E11A9